MSVKTENSPDKQIQNGKISKHKQSLRKTARQERLHGTLYREHIADEEGRECVGLNTAKQRGINKAQVKHIRVGQKETKNSNEE